MSQETLDPQAALQQAKEQGLVILRENPLNCEMPVPAQTGLITPIPHFYIRTNFPIPKIDPATWRLSVTGEVERPLSLSVRDIRNLPSKSLIVTTECAGNGRSKLDPPAEGEQWQLGAVSTGEWTGVPLVEVLERAGLKRSAIEIVFRGTDQGVPRGRTETITFERSLKLDWARNPDVLLAYAMNGETLPVEHGFPLRVLVPSWYGMASVKWLAEIVAIDHEFKGHYQVNSYVFERQQADGVVKVPVTQERVRALVTEPAKGGSIEKGEAAIRGVAWSGTAPIAKVEVSVDGGPWQEARLLDDPQLRYAWRRWELLTRLDRAGEVSVRARATDADGSVQPETPDWNRLGYGNNAIQEHTFTVG